MADETPETPDLRAQRRRPRRGDRRKRLALLLVLFALGVGASLFAPGIIELGRAPGAAPKPTKRPVRSNKPLVRHHWRFDFSMGPILELVEQSLNLRPFDLRRPVRIPLRPHGPGSRSGDILLAQPQAYQPPFVPSADRPVGPLPGPEYAGIPRDAGTPWVTPGGGLPTGEPDYDPELNTTDERLEDPGIPVVPTPVPTSVPEPGMLWLVGSGLLAVAARRRR